MLTITHVVFTGTVVFLELPHGDQMTKFQMLYTSRAIVVLKWKQRIQ